MLLLRDAKCIIAIYICAKNDTNNHVCAVGGARAAQIAQTATQVSHMIQPSALKDRPRMLIAISNTVKHLLCDTRTTLAFILFFINNRKIQMILQV